MVFGYGSLMWRPDFDYLDRAPARLMGYHRRFCVYSHHHRGTPEKPGLVLGLMRGGACRGIVYRVAADKAADTIAYLRAREQVTLVYREAQVACLRLTDGHRLAGVLTYVAEPGHVQYAGRLDMAAQARLIAQGVGKSGCNRDYLDDFIAHLREEGIRDRSLEALQRAVREMI